MGLYLSFVEESLQYLIYTVKALVVFFSLHCSILVSDANILVGVVVGVS